MLIGDALHAIDHGKAPMDEAIIEMEAHQTREKVLGKRTIAETLWFMTYPSMSHAMEIIET